MRSRPYPCERFADLAIRYLRSVSDPETKAKWTRVKEDLTAEFRIIQELANELNNFKVTVSTVPW